MEPPHVAASRSINMLVRPAWLRLVETSAMTDIDTDRNAPVPNKFANVCSARMSQKPAARCCSRKTRSPFARKLRGGITAEVV